MKNVSQAGFAQYLTLRSIFFKGKIGKVSVVSGSVEPEAIVQVKVKCNVHQSKIAAFAITKSHLVTLQYYRKCN